MTLERMPETQAAASVLEEEAQEFLREEEAHKAERWGRFPIWVPLLGIIVLAAFLRLWQIDAVGYNSDEAVYSGQAAAIADDAASSSSSPPYAPTRC